MELTKLVEEELAKEEDSKILIPLWRQIHSWYDEGGPSAVEANLKHSIKEAEKTVSENIKALPEVKTRRKTKRKRR